MKRFLPHVFCVIGLMLVVIGFAVGPGIPYPDPTPEIRLVVERKSERLAVLAIAGLLLIVTGGVWIVTRWLRRRFYRKPGA